MLTDLTAQDFIEIYGAAAEAEATMIANEYRRARNSDLLHFCERLVSDIRHIQKGHARHDVAGEAGEPS